MVGETWSQWAATKRRTPAPRRMPPRMRAATTPVAAGGLGLGGLVGAQVGGCGVVVQAGLLPAGGVGFGRLHGRGR